MSETQTYDVAPVKQKENTSLTTKLALAVTAASVAMLPAVSFAAGEITTIGEGLTAEIDASKAIVVAIFGAGALLLALFAGYRYMKRGANSA